MYEGGTGPLLSKAPTLNIVTLGRQLAIFEHVDNCGKLLKKLRDRDASAYAELSAIWLACNSQELEIENKPQATVSGRKRKSDFRIRQDMEPWIVCGGNAAKPVGCPGAYAHSYKCSWLEP